MKAFERITVGKVEVKGSNLIHVGTFGQQQCKFENAEEVTVPSLPFQYNAKLAATWGSSQASLLIFFSRLLSFP